MDLIGKAKNLADTVRVTVQEATNSVNEVVDAAKNTVTENDRFRNSYAQPERRRSRLCAIACLGNHKTTSPVVLVVPPFPVVLG